MQVSNRTNGRTAADEPLRALITSGGGPGVWGLLAALRSMPRRRVTVLVQDCAEDATLGTLMADTATRLPPASDPGYVDALLAFCRRERVDVLIPVYDGELLAVAARRSEFAQSGTAVLLPPRSVVETCRDKAATHLALADTPLVPRFRVATQIEDTLAAIAALGYPRNVLAVRPIDLAGGRGLHILDSRTDAFREHMLCKPGPHRLCAEEFLRIRAKGPAEFPLLITEYLPGDELGIDLLAEDGRVVDLVVRRKGGPALHGNPAHIEFAEKPGEREWIARLAAALRLSGLLSIDARYDSGGGLRLLEVNPRPGAYIGMSCARLHLLAWAIDRLLGESDGVREDYAVNESLTHGLRAFGDVVFGAGPDDVAVLAPTARTDSAFRPNQDTNHARRLPCSTPR